MNEKNALLFRVNTLLLSVPITCVSSVEARPQTVAVIPHSPVYVTGVCSCHGRRITLIDVGKLLGIDKNTEQPLIVLVGDIGLLVEKVIGVEALSQCDQYANELFAQISTCDIFFSKELGEIVYELDISKINNSFGG